MTLEQAQEIRELMNERGDLFSELRDLVSCDSIDGHINEGENGLGFRWDSNSIEVKWLIKGITVEIERIEETIARIQLNDSTERSENGTR